VNPLGSLLPYLRRHRRALEWGFAALVVSDAFQLASPWVFKFAIDGLGKNITRPKLAAFAAALLGMAILGGLARYAMRRLIIGTSREIEYELRNDFFDRLSRLSFSFYNRTPTGDLMAKATNDLNAVRNVLGPGIMYSLNTAVTLSAALVLMIALSWQLTLVSLVPLPLISLFMFRYGKLIHKRFEVVQGQFSEITARAQEYLSGIRVVKAYVREDAASRDFEGRNLAYLRGNMDLVKINGVFSPAIGFLAGLGSVLVLFAGGILVIRGRITLGSFVAFNAYLAMLIWPMIALGWVVSIFQRGAASMKRMNEVLQAVPEIRDPEGASTPPGGNGDGGDPAPGPELEFRGVRFAYGTRPEVTVLDGIDLRIRPGEVVALVGRTGSGKTTLVNLVPRLFDPKEGSILLDGRDLREIPLDELRGIVGYVPQETFLFSRTLGENIALGRPDAGALDIDRMADLSRLSDEVLEFPKGYDTMVGERGVTLSGGQKQRTAIARALLRNPGILILDDALASVDTRTEEAILAGLRGYMTGRTTLLVAHRVSTIRLADRIVVLDRGRITEEGTHEALFAAGGTYAEIVRKQMLEEELEAAL
jgi:ATP-binding cassette, subfamily B, multidrug efflux pump